MQRFICRIDYEGPGRQETILASKGLGPDPVAPEDMSARFKLLEEHGALFAEWLVDTANRHFTEGVIRRLGPYLNQRLEELGLEVDRLAEGGAYEGQAEVEQWLEDLGQGVEALKKDLAPLAMEPLSVVMIGEWGTAAHYARSQEDGSILTLCGTRPIVDRYVPLRNEKADCKRCLKAAGEES